VERVSVVMAVRDGERWLAEALESVAAQTHPVAEVVLVDGGSTDRTVAIAREARVPGLRVVAQGRRGIADAYNVGVAATTCPLVAFLSCDDRWTPAKTTAQVAWLDASPAARFVTGHARFELEPGCALPRGYRADLVGAVRPATIMETLLARREVFDEVGPFDPARPVAEDVDWFSRARDLGVPHGQVADVVVVKRIHDRNATGDAARNTRELLEVARRAAARKRGSAAP
jgi:glycosyltransferase involved in cell wall biosynthesis